MSGSSGSRGEVDATESDAIPEEARLLAAVRYALSTPKARVALRLQLSRLAPPLPRPHHRRIARAILDEAAQRYDGDLFDLACGDMVLLCRAPSHGGADPAAHPASLPHALSRLFRADVPDGGALTQMWTLERDGAVLLAYAAQLAAG
jgi:hypothetical protein